jgi:hypothetical protein
VVESGATNNGRSGQASPAGHEASAPGEIGRRGLMKGERNIAAIRLRVACSIWCQTGWTCLVAQQRNVRQQSMGHGARLPTVLQVESLGRREGNAGIGPVHAARVSSPNLTTLSCRRIADAARNSENSQNLSISSRPRPRKRATGDLDKEHSFQSDSSEKIHEKARFGRGVVR